MSNQPDPGRRVQAHRSSGDPNCRASSSFCARTSGTQRGARQIPLLGQGGESVFSEDLKVAQVRFITTKLTSSEGSANCRKSLMIAPKIFQALRCFTCRILFSKWWGKYCSEFLTCSRSPSVYSRRISPVPISLHSFNWY